METQSIPWWRRSLIFKLEEKGAKPGAELWYDYFWRQRKPSAWGYELVRNLAFARRSIPPAVRQEVQTLPPYPQLSLRQKQFLQAILWPENLFPVQAVGSSRQGYTDPLPPIAFNFLRGKQQVRDFVNKWYEGQEQLHARLEFRKKGRVRNKDQTYRLGDWSLVEILSELQTDANKDRRHYALTYAKKFYPLVRFAMQLAAAPVQAFPSRQPVIPTLIGRTCTTSQLLRAITEACRTAGRENLRAGEVLA